MKEPIICDFCGEILTDETAHKFDGKILCESCLNENTTLCSCCLDRIWSDEAEGNDILTLCRYCYENNYVTCSSCGSLIHNDDACYDDDNDDAYCQSCYDKLSSNEIRAYNYKPYPIFRGEGFLYMGVELEIDEGGENSHYARKIMDIANRDCEHIYCKHDGSLDDGFEIVSHPMTLHYHTNEMNWREVMEKAVDLGYTSHNAGSCGLHIHCNRDYFGKEYDEQEEAIGRIVYFVERHWDELVRFSRRTPGALNRWAAKYATISNTICETYEKAKNKDMGRYVAVNLSNYRTIEFRMFRGTLRYDTFMAALQLVDEICRLAIRLSDYEMEQLSWSEFVGLIDPRLKPELITYLKSRRLYVNEPETAEEEM